MHFWGEWNCLNGKLIVTSYIDICCMVEKMKIKIIYNKRVKTVIFYKVRTKTNDDI